MIKAIYIYVGTAGIGRMSFGSWLSFDEIDRADGDDDDTYPSIGAALVGAGAEVERRMIVGTWEAKTFKPPGLPPAGIVTKGHADIFVARVTWSGIRFAAEWMHWTPNGYQLEDVDDSVYDQQHGDTIAEALGVLGKRATEQLSHSGWVNQFR